LILFKADVQKIYVTHYF